MNEAYKKLLELRKRKDLKLAKNPFLKDNVVLRYYQIIGAVHMFMVRRFVLGDATGTGKTIQTITAYLLTLTKEANQKLIIICPSSAMYQWGSELDKFTNGITWQVVESGDIRLGKGKANLLTGYKSREYLFNKFKLENKHVLIFNYNTLVSDYTPILEKIIKEGKYTVVFDEATSFKSTKTQTYLYAKKLAEIADRSYALSATIIKNNLKEAFAIFKVVVPGLFLAVEHFEKSYCIKEKKQLWKGKGERGKVVSKIIGYKNLDHFRKTIDPYFLGRKKSDVASELPQIISKEIKIKMNKQQQELYDDVVGGFINYNKFPQDHAEKIQYLFKNEGDEEYQYIQEYQNVKKVEKLASLIYLQQICNSPEILGFKAASEKEKELIRLLETELAGEKVVIYTRFKKMIYRLEKLIQEELEVKTTRIHGDVENRDREANKKEFNESEDCNIIFINAAAKEAVNLQSSGYLIFYDLPFSYGDFLQIIGRIHRIGSKFENISLIYLLCNNSVDEHTYKILSTKKGLFDRVLGDSAEGAIKIEEQENVIDTLFGKVVNKDTEILDSFD